MRQEAAAIKKGIIMESKIMGIDNIISKENNQEVKLEINKKKRGPKKNGELREIKLSESGRYYVDVSDNQEVQELLKKMLLDANNKTFGQKITLREVIILALSKITSKDIEKLQEASISKREKVQRALDDYNSKNEVKLKMEDFLLKRLGLN